MRVLRDEITALIEPGCTEGLVGGASAQLVTITMKDWPSEDRQALPDSTIYIRPAEARELAVRLLELAEHAAGMVRER
jgi:hypothetical protein